MSFGFLAIIFASPFVLAVILITLGVRGRWQRADPRCARCAQLVGAHEVMTSTRCPECGHQLDAPGGVSFFVRRRRVVMTSIGAALILAAFFMPPLLARYRLSSATMPSQLPTTVLIAALAKEQCAMEMHELERRASSGTLSTDELREIIEALRSVPNPNDPRRIFSMSKEILAIARRRGVLDDGLALGLLDAWYPADQVARLPSIVRRASSPMMRAQIHDQHGPIVVTASVSDVSIDGTPVEVESFGSSTGGTIDLLQGGRFSLDAAPGRHALRFQLRRSISFPQIGTGTGAPSMHDERVVVLPIDVIDEGAPSFIATEAPPSLADDVRRACRGAAVAIDRASSDGSCHVRADASLAAVPDIDLSFELFADIDGKEVPLGWLTAWMRGRSTSSSSGLNVGVLKLCPQSIPETVTLRWRPAPRHRESDPDARAVWGAVIEIPDVPVRSNLRSH